jgi:hypothetical protein
MRRVTRGITYGARSGIDWRATPCSARNKQRLLRLSVVLHSYGARATMPFVCLCAAQDGSIKHRVRCKVHAPFRGGPGSPNKDRLPCYASVWPEDTRMLRAYRCFLTIVVLLGSLGVPYLLADSTAGFGWIVVLMTACTGLLFSLYELWINFIPSPRKTRGVQITYTYVYAGISLLSSLGGCMSSYPRDMVFFRKPGCVLKPG